MATLGERLRQAREACGLTQHDVSVRTGLRIAYLSEVETGKVDPRISVVQRLARLYGVSLADLEAGVDPADRGTAVSGRRGMAAPTAGWTSAS